MVEVLVIIEKAIIQDVTGRDGTSRPYERPKEIRQIVRRMQAWKRAQEGCSNCRQSATTVRNGLAFCPVCSEQYQARFAPVLSDRGVLPFVERRTEPDEKGIAGLFIVFNSESLDLGGFTEVIKPSAVDRSMKDGDIRALWGHDTSIVIGRRSADTLRLEKQRNGLFGTIAPPAWAANHVETVERRDVTGASFGFSVYEDVWHFSEEKILREVLDMEIFEVSPVGFPAYPATKIKVERMSERKERQTLEQLRMAR